MVLDELFPVKKPIIGMVHSLPLPGSPKFKQYRLDVYDYAVNEALKLKEGGVDGLLIENAGDIPFVKSEYLGPETAACIAVIGERIRKAVPDLPIGVNIVANAAKHSIAATEAFGGSFVRVNQWANAYIANEGFVEGAAGVALRYRSMIGADDIKVLADVHVKHGSHAIVADRPISEQATDVAFFDADALIATGFRTGDPTRPEEINTIREGSSLPVLIGSGINAENCQHLLRIADGAILGVSVKKPHSMAAPTDPESLRIFMDKIFELRMELK